MGLLDSAVKEGFDALKQKIDSRLSPKVVTISEMRTSLATNDFKQGFEIIEVINGKITDFSKRERVLFTGDAMPHQPFNYGGTQKIIKDYYPGRSEPTIQVLGPRENNITIKGRFKSKKLKNPQKVTPAVTLGPFQTKPPAEISGPPPGGVDDLRPYAQELQELVTAMRIRGNLVRITMGEFQRFGFIEEAKFDMKTIADIDYEITFAIIGVNPPSDCKVLKGVKSVPTKINKELINEANKQFEEALVLPEAFPRSFGDQLRDAIDTVASAVNLVTDFVDTILDEVDDIKSAVKRAEGLVKHARNTIRSQGERIGLLSPLGGFDPGNPSTYSAGISDAYRTANHIQETLSGFYSLTALLANITSQLSDFIKTEPLARHRIITGDNLQRIATTYYNDSSQWELIFDHNNLDSTDLTARVGEILEIPRLQAKDAEES